MSLTKLLFNIFKKPKMPLFLVTRVFSGGGEKVLKFVDTENKMTETSKLALTGVQIEHYKRQLYDLIKQHRDPQEINQLTRFLIDSCEPSLHLFNIILKGQLMMKNVEGIKETLLLIAKNKFAFNAVTLNLLLVYYRDLDMMEEAEKLFRAMENRKKDDNPLINCAGPNLAAYTTMIAGWARRGEYEKAKEYYEAIEKEGGLVIDEHATCALLSSAVSSGHLEEAKKLFHSIKGQPNFITMKLWLRACFRLGGYEEILMKLLKMEEQSLELGELIKWILTDLKGEASKLSKVSVFILDKSLEGRVRLGDPQCLHFLLDSLKRDPAALILLSSISLKWSENILPVIGGRLLHQLVTMKSKEMAGKIVKECERLGIKLPSGLLIDFSAFNNQ
jgi:pentatricopeptide repeat protein